jgi:hypothetical protein
MTFDTCVPARIVGHQALNSLMETLLCAALTAKDQGQTIRTEGRLEHVAALVSKDVRWRSNQPAGNVRPGHSRRQGSRRRWHRLIARQNLGQRTETAVLTGGGRGVDFLRPGRAAKAAGSSWPGPGRR